MGGAGGGGACPLTVADLAGAGVGAAALAGALGARGCKGGGTWQQRAERLLEVLGRAPGDIPRQHLAPAKRAGEER